MTDEHDWQPARFPTVQEYLRHHPNVQEADLQPWRLQQSGRVIRVRPIPDSPKLRRFAKAHREAGGCDATVFLHVHPEDAERTIGGATTDINKRSAAICEYDALTD